MRRWQQMSERMFRTNPRVTHNDVNFGGVICNNRWPSVDIFTEHLFWKCHMLWTGVLPEFNTSGKSVIIQSSETENSRSRNSTMSVFYAIEGIEQSRSLFSEKEKINESQPKCSIAHSSHLGARYAAMTIIIFDFFFLISLYEPYIIIYEGLCLSGSGAA